MKFTLLAFVSLVFLGCTNTLPPKVEYRVAPAAIEIKKDSTINGCSKQSLKVLQGFSANYLRSKEMSYRMGSTKQYIYASALWSESPNRAITTEFFSLIRDSELFKSVQNSQSRSRSDMILELNIEDFMQYYNENATESYVNASISLSLIDTKTKSVFASERFEKKLVISGLNSNAGVVGLSNALEDVLLQSSQWLYKVCQ